MMKRKFPKIIYFLLCFLFIFEQSGFAQIAGQLDISGYFTGLRDVLIQDKFRPLHLRYLAYNNSNNNLKLLLDKGDINLPQTQELENSTKELLNYFFVGISLPNDSFWVNLRPDSPDNIIDSYLVQTDLGKILLEADLQLKKDTASFTSPQTPEGKDYWRKLYQKSNELFGGENITIPTLTRPWIVPGEIIIRETRENAYVYKATLKVMLEQDYLKDSATYNFTDERLKQLNEYASELIRKTIIPKLTKDVNTAKRYAPLRQVYYSLILAQWFKQEFYGKGGLYSHLINKKNLNGLTSKEAWSKDTYFQAYQKSFREGEYNIKEPVYTLQGQTIRSYMSGGITIGEEVIREAINSGKGITGDHLRPIAIFNHQIPAQLSPGTVQNPYSGEINIQPPKISSSSPVASLAAESDKKAESTQAWERFITEYYPYAATDKLEQLKTQPWQEEEVIHDLMNRPTPAIVFRYLRYFKDQPLAGEIAIAAARKVSNIYEEATNLFENLKYFIDMPWAEDVVSKVGRQYPSIARQHKSAFINQPWGKRAWKEINASRRRAARNILTVITAVAAITVAPLIIGRISYSLDKRPPAVKDVLQQLAVKDDPGHFFEDKFLDQYMTHTYGEDIFIEALRNYDRVLSSNSPEAVWKLLNQNWPRFEEEFQKYMIKVAKKAGSPGTRTPAITSQGFSEYYDMRYFLRLAATKYSQPEQACARYERIRANVVKGLREQGYNYWADILEAEIPDFMQFEGRPELLSRLAKNKLEKDKSDSRLVAVDVMPVYGGDDPAFRRATQEYNVPLDSAEIKDIHYVAGDKETVVRSIQEATGWHKTPDGKVVVNHPADIIVLAGHGDITSIKFGENAYLTVADKQWLIEQIRPCLKKGGTVILSSCSTGAGRASIKNMANMLREVFPQAETILAPEEASYGEKLIISRDKKVDVRYRGPTETQGGVPTYRAELGRETNEMFASNTQLSNAARRGFLESQIPKDYQYRAASSPVLGKWAQKAIIGLFISALPFITTMDVPSHWQRNPLVRSINQGEFGSLERAALLSVNDSLLLSKVLPSIDYEGLVAKSAGGDSEASFQLLTLYEYTRKYGLWDEFVSDSIPEYLQEKIRNIDANVFKDGANNGNYFYIEALDILMREYGNNTVTLILDNIKLDKLIEKANQGDPHAYVIVEILDMDFYGSSGYFSKIDPTALVNRILSGEKNVYFEKAVSLYADLARGGNVKKLVSLLMEQAKAGNVDAANMFVKVIEIDLKQWFNEDNIEKNIEPYLGLFFDLAADNQLVKDLLTWFCNRQVLNLRNAHLVDRISSVELEKRLMQGTVGGNPHLLYLAFSSNEMFGDLAKMIFDKLQNIALQKGFSDVGSYLRSVDSGNIFYTDFILQSANFNLLGNMINSPESLGKITKLLFGDFSPDYMKNNAARLALFVEKTIKDKNFKYQKDFQESLLNLYGSAKDDFHRKFLAAILSWYKKDLNYLGEKSISVIENKEKVSYREVSPQIDYKNLFKDGKLIVHLVYGDPDAMVSAYGSGGTLDFFSNQGYVVVAKTSDRTTIENPAGTIRIVLIDNSRYDSNYDMDKEALEGVGIFGARNHSGNSGRTFKYLNNVLDSKLKDIYKSRYFILGQCRGVSEMSIIENFYDVAGIIAVDGTGVGVITDLVVWEFVENLASKKYSTIYDVDQATKKGLPKAVIKEYVFSSDRISTFSGFINEIFSLPPASSPVNATEDFLIDLEIDAIANSVSEAIARSRAGESVNLLGIYMSGVTTNLAKYKDAGLGFNATLDRLSTAMRAKGIDETQIGQLNHEIRPWQGVIEQLAVAQKQNRENIGVANTKLAKNVEELTVGGKEIVINETSIDSIFAMLASGQMIQGEINSFGKGNYFKIAKSGDEYAISPDRTEVLLLFDKDSFIKDHGLIPEQDFITRKHLRDGTVTEYEFFIIRMNLPMHGDYLKYFKLITPDGVSDFKNTVSASSPAGQEVNGIAKEAAALFNADILSQCVDATRLIAERLEQLGIPYKILTRHIPHDASKIVEIGDATDSHTMLEAVFDNKVWVIDTQLKQFTLSNRNKLKLPEEFISQYIYQASDYYTAVPVFSDSICAERVISATLSVDQSTSSPAESKQLSDPSVREGFLKLFPGRALDFKIDGEQVVNIADPEILSFLRNNQINIVPESPTGNVTRWKTNEIFDMAQWLHLESMLLISENGKIYIAKLKDSASAANKERSLLNERAKVWTIRNSEVVRDELELGLQVIPNTGNFVITEFTLDYRDMGYIGPLTIGREMFAVVKPSFDKIRNYLVDNGIVIDDKISNFLVKISNSGDVSVIPIDFGDERSSSPITTDTKGGIDFRTMPITTQPVMNAQLSNMPAPRPLVGINLDESWGQIQNMLNAGIIPSSERIKEYLQVCCGKEDLNKEIDKILACIADILRLQEERVISTDLSLKEMLALLESDKPANEMQFVLAKIIVEEKKPLAIAQ